MTLLAVGPNGLGVSSVTFIRNKLEWSKDNANDFNGSVKLIASIVMQTRLIKILQRYTWKFILVFLTFKLMHNAFIKISLWLYSQLLRWTYLNHTERNGDRGSMWKTTWDKLWLMQPTPSYGDLGFGLYIVVTSLSVALSVASQDSGF